MQMLDFFSELSCDGCEDNNRQKLPVSKKNIRLEEKKRGLCRLNSACVVADHLIESQLLSAVVVLWSDCGVDIDLISISFLRRFGS
jgi:hypothetical protein